MARTPERVPGLQKMHIPETRKAIPALHAYLRERILDGTLPPDTKLSQAGLAEQLGVSRTPLREVLRMLHDEGLVVMAPNQRTRVAALDPQELDEVYATRILLETLALSLTLDRFTPADQDQAERLLADMRQAARNDDFETWFSFHRRFHRLTTKGAGPPLRRQLAIFADRTIRYIRIYQFSEPESWHEIGEREHAEILKTLVAQDRGAALSALARHLARTAKKVMRDCVPEYPVQAVPHALDLVERCAG
jgi:DNA-binding GntR family transcriptional regulator